ncbi:hypothetical protein Ddye_029669 [Dipteronia dyeriana]|uniref:peptidylprolyl isomerase n=1 Tax=Dipteronia dyeriana TaxID=168575 RepID=A0AAD9WLR1_9ROSI|nr:hypothetical protein Ddye_029669 [Dipteronia dyeriana]
MIQCFASAQSLHTCYHPTLHFHSPKISAKFPSSSSSSSSSFLSTNATRRGALSSSIGILSLSFYESCSKSDVAATEFLELPNSGGVKVLDLRIGTGPIPVDGDQVAIHYYGRLAAKQGWRFDSTYDHKDPTGEPIPFVFVLGRSANVILGIEAAVRSMKVGGIRRAVIPPSQGYQNTSQQPIPPNLPGYNLQFTIRCGIHCDEAFHIFGVSFCRLPCVMMSSKLITGFTNKDAHSLPHTISEHHRKRKKMCVANRRKR